MAIRAHLSGTVAEMVSVEEDEHPIRRLAIQHVSGTSTSWDVVSVSRIICAFRGYAMGQGFVSPMNSDRLKPDRIYVRTAGCHTLKGGVYLTFYRSLKHLKRVLPSDVFLGVNPNTLLNQNFLLGSKVFEMKGNARVLSIHDDPSLLPVRLIVTRGYLRDVKKALGIPVRPRRKR